MCKRLYNLPVPTDARVSICNAVASVPTGRWIVGVSGGADSVALLVALRCQRPELELTVAHLNHEMRGTESDGDAHFVDSLCRALGVSCVIRRISEVAVRRLPNLEAHFREARLTLFRELASAHHLDGVLLAQHADDRAETVFMRLLRGGDSSALDGLRGDTTVEGLRLLRPFIAVRRTAINAFLINQSQPWRNDGSNASDVFARNRARQFLRHRDDCTRRLLALADAARRWRFWIDAHAPSLPSEMPVSGLADLPDPLARHALRRWIRSHGITPDHVAPDQIEQLIAMSRDRSTPATLNLPGGRTAHRRRGAIEIRG